LFVPFIPKVKAKRFMGERPIFLSICSPSLKEKEKKERKGRFGSHLFAIADRYG